LVRFDGDAGKCDRDYYIGIGKWDGHYVNIETENRRK